MEHLGLVHTVAGLTPTFSALVGELLPDVATTVIADELLLKRTVRDGVIDDVTTERLRSHVAALADFGVDAMLVTCSSIGNIVDRIAAESSVPVHRIDRPMAEAAVMLGATVGVLATLPTTLAPTTDIVKLSARALDREIEIVPRLCEGAFAALSSGDPDRHDAMVAGELERLATAVDVVVLAQASMARIAEGQPTGDTPVLSSPRMAIERLAAE